MPKQPTTRARRTPEQQIEDLQKKIEAVKARAARAKVKKDPALRHINGAVRSIDKAAKATGDNAVRKALEDARATLGACLAMNGASPGKSVLKPRRAAARVAATIDPGAVLVYVRNNPGSSGEQVAEEMGTDTATLRPVLRGLIDAGEVKATGDAVRRGVGSPQSMPSAQNRIVFDTTAINTLHDDPARAAVLSAFGRKGWLALASMINVCEIAATGDQVRRDSLFSFAGELRLQGDYRLLPHPILGMVVKELEAWLMGMEIVSYGIDDSLGWMQDVLHEPASRTAEAIAAAIEWKRVEEERFASFWEPFRTKWSPVIKKNPLPPTAAAFVEAVFRDTPLLVTTFRSLFNDYPEVKDRGDTQIAEFARLSGSIRLFIVTQSTAIFHHVLAPNSRSPHRKRDPMALDLAQAVYLAAADTLVTDDSGLGSRFRDVCRAHCPGKSILTTRQFLDSLSI